MWRQLLSRSRMKVAPVLRWWRCKSKLPSAPFSGTRQPVVVSLTVSAGAYCKGGTTGITTLPDTHVADRGRVDISDRRPSACLTHFLVGYVFSAELGTVLHRIVRLAS